MLMILYREEDLADSEYEGNLDDSEKEDYLWDYEN